MVFTGTNLLVACSAYSGAPNQKLRKLANKDRLRLLGRPTEFHIVQQVTPRSWRGLEELKCTAKVSFTPNAENIKFDAKDYYYSPFSCIQL